MRLGHDDFAKVDLFSYPLQIISCYKWDCKTETRYPHKIEGFRLLIVSFFSWKGENSKYNKNALILNCMFEKIVQTILYNWKLNEGFLLWWTSTLSLSLLNKFAIWLLFFCFKRFFILASHAFSKAWQKANSGKIPINHQNERSEF